MPHAPGKADDFCWTPKKSVKGAALVAVMLGAKGSAFAGWLNGSGGACCCAAAFCEIHSTATGRLGVRPSCYSPSHAAE